MSREYISIDRIPECRKEYAHVEAPLHSLLLPHSVDLRPKMPEVYNQGQLGSCSANALCAAIEYDLPGFMGSRLFLYYNERLIENTTSSDCGATLTDGIASLKKYGICNEALYPYNIEKFSQAPIPRCYQEAKHHRVVNANNVKQDINIIKNWLNIGYPIVVAIEVFDEFESQQVAKTGVVPMPTATSNCQGGHAILVVGYDDSKHWWICRNSWGKDWGDNGYFYLPYHYLLDSSMSSDMWVIRSLTIR